MVNFSYRKIMSHVLKLHNARLSTSDVALNTSITIIHENGDTLGPCAASPDSSQRWTEIKRLTRQASDQITPRRTTCTHFTIAISEHTNGNEACG